MEGVSFKRQKKEASAYRSKGGRSWSPPSRPYEELKKATSDRGWEKEI